MMRAVIRVVVKAIVLLVGILIAQAIHGDTIRTPKHGRNMPSRSSSHPKNSLTRTNP